MRVKKISRLILLLLFIILPLFVLLQLVVTKPVLGGDEACTFPDGTCYSTRIINQWSCAECELRDNRCAGDPGVSCTPGSCGVHGGPCINICIDTSYIGQCNIINESVGCNTSSGNCQWTGTLDNCVWSGENCSEPGTTTTLGCCGPGGGAPPTSTPAPPPTPTPTPSCSVDLTPSTVSISVGASTNFIASVVPSGGTVDQVNFSSSNISVATVNPSSDATAAYQTSATGQSIGSATITSDVVMGVVRCTDTAALEVISPGPWWQVQDADIITNGNLSSLIPATTCFLPGCDPAFGLEGSGGYPGVPSYGGSYDFEAGSGTGTVSSTGWLANSMTTLNKVYDYSYFQSMVRSNVEINEIVEPEIQGGYLINQGNQSRGYVWFKRQGDLTITGVANLQSRKVVLLVDGDLYLGRPPAQSGSNIRVQDGTGFFMAIVSGDIIISPKAEIDPLNPQPVFEGIFLAEGQVKTGTDGPGLDGQLWIRGSVAAYGGIVLERDLTDNGLTPAEFFEYGPDLLFTFPRDLTSRKYKWKEIAP